ncbi:MAG: DUF86 domain-containing protein [Clostridia bacterium]|nr:DUF86 domain-containing protein [Clostridia bacterium]
MTVADRDRQLLGNIAKYCREIEHAHSEYGGNYQVFCSNPTYRNAVAMCLMQIGELAGRLSDEFRAANTGIPWRAIRGMRNVVAHEYGGLDIEMLWETAGTDTQELLAFCLNFIRKP